MTQEYKYTRPWMYPKQLEAIFNPFDCDGKPARMSFVEASTKTGKTVSCITWLFEQAYQASVKGRNYWWVAPVYPQARIAYSRMKRGMPQRIYSSHDGDQRLTLINGSSIWFKSGEKPDNLYGEDVWAAVMDEASRARAEAWHAVRSTLTATQGPLRAIGNVKGRKNWFYDLCRRAEKGSPGLSYHRMVAYDAVKAGVLTKDEVESAQRDLPAGVFKELYLAEPNDDGGNPFGTDAQIAACVKPMSRKPPKAWGWDLAKAVDWTVGVGLDENGDVCEFQRFQKPWDETIRIIKSMTGRVPALVDSTGVGDPVVELLQKELGSNFEGFKYSSQSKQQIMEGLAVSIQNRKVGYPDGPIVIELKQFEYEYTRTGARYSAPEGAHDDCVCALAQANHHLTRAKKPMLINREAAAVFINGGSRLRREMFQ